MTKKGKIIILSGPSGSGKTTLYKKLLAGNKRLVRSVSVTTRPRRPGERHGKDYFFISKKMFLYKKAHGHLLESEKVFDNYYGTPNKNVQDSLRRGKNVLLSIDVDGARTVARKYPDAVRIFVRTSSLETLKKRLGTRGSESKRGQILRLRRAQKELRAARRYDHVVINDDLSRAVRDLKKIVEQVTE